jgi:hypothetical protein
MLFEKKIYTQYIKRTNAMFCSTEREMELLGKLQRQFPEKNELILELVAWVYLNKPERFEQIMKEHEERGQQLIDLTNVDYKNILREN